MCVVIDLDVVCLVCLHHSGEMHGIFSSDSADSSPDISINQKIAQLSKLKVDANNESLPDKICGDCLKDLTAAWRFHKNCQTAVAVFQSILKPLTHQVQPTAPSRSLDNATEDVTANENQLTAQQQLADVTGCDSHEVEQSVISPAVEDHDNIEDEIVVDLVEKETSSEFLELHQCVVEEEHDDYQSIAETADEDMELVEYYLADDALHEHQEEIIDNTVETCTVKGNNETSTIASKKIVMKTEQHAKVWPAILSKSAAATTAVQQPPTALRSRLRPSHTQEIPKIVKTTENRKSPKEVKRPNRFEYSQQLTANKEDQEFSQNQLTENEDEFEFLARPVVKSSRKRKSSSPDTKPPKICEICGNSYRFQHALNAHMRRHFQDKPFPCEMCDKAFVSNVELRRHMRVHTGHKPYPCQYCDRRFSDFGSRIKHERTHTGERPYICITCGKSFAYPHVLSVHLRTHTGEKKFRCDHCTKGFTKKAYLLSHIEQHHALAMEDDAVADTAEDGNDVLSSTKTVKFDDCIFSPEFVSEADGVQQDDEGEELDEEEGDSQDDDENNTMILQESLLRPKTEGDDDDDTDIQEVEIHLDEYTIRVR